MLACAVMASVRSGEIERTSDGGSVTTSGARHDSAIGAASRIRVKTIE